MAFTLSGSTIIQTATDADLSGLAGVAGVSVTTYGNYSLYDLGTLPLQIDGDLTIIPEENAFITNADALTSGNAQPCRVTSTGTLRLGEITVSPVVGGAPRYSRGVCMILAEPGNLNNLRSWEVEAGGTLVWNGGTVQVQGAVAFQDTSIIEINAGTILTMDGDYQVRVQHSDTSTCLIQNEGLTLDGTGGACRLTTTARNTFSAFKFNFVNGQYQPYAGGWPNQVFNNFDNGSNVATADFAYANGQTTLFGNIVDFRNVSRRLVYTNANSGRGLAQTTRRVNFAVNDSTGAAVNDLSYYAVDTDNSSRFVVPNFDAVGSSLDLTPDIVYAATASPSMFTEDVIAEYMYGEGTTRTIDNRTDADDTLLFRFVAYNTLIAEVRPVLIGLGELATPVVAALDTATTINTGDAAADQATALALTSTPDNATLYDHLKALFVRDFTGEGELTVTRDGDFGSRAVSFYIFPSATDVGPTAVSFYAGPAFSGSITAPQINIPSVGVSVTGSTFAGQCNIPTAIDLTNVAIDGPLVYNDNTNRTITYDGVAAQTVRNDGTGIITIYLAGGSTIADSSDPQIVVLPAPTPSSFTFTSKNNDTPWALYDDANVRITSGIGSTSYSNAIGDSGLWSLVAHEAGRKAEIYTWNAEAGTNDSAAYNGSILLRPEGGPIYSGGSTAGIVVFVNADGWLQVNVPNSATSPQAIIDAQQDFLSTLAGLDYIRDLSILEAPTWGDLNGTTYLINVTGYQYDSIVGASPEAAIAGILISSAFHDNIRTDENGNLTVIAAATSPWDSQLPDHLVAGSFGEWVSLLPRLTDMEASAALTAVADVSGLPTAALIADQVRIELAAELARLDATVSSVQYDDSALTGLVNLLPRIADMEASAALTAVADVSGLSTHDPASVVAALQAVADDFKADVSGLATTASTATALAEIRANQVQINDAAKNNSTLNPVPYTADVPHP